MKKLTNLKENSIVTIEMNWNKVEVTKTET